MFKLDNEEDLLAAFRPRDRALIELAPEVRFPAIVRTYLAWAHPAGSRVFLVFAVPGGRPIGIAFEKSGAGPAVPHLCDWCHGYGSGTGVGLLCARVNSKQTAGVHVCTDLSCQQKLEDQANRSGRNLKPALEALIARMGRFAAEGLGIDLAGAGR